MTRFRPSLRLLLGIGIAAGTLAGAASATEPVGDQFQVSNQLPAGNADFFAVGAAVAHNTTNGDYLVVWAGDTAVEGEREIFGRIFGFDRAAKSAEFRISDMGPEGSELYDARDPAAAYNPVSDEYFVVWSGNDTTARGTFDSGGAEIHGQRLSATGAEVGPNDVLLSETGPSGSNLHDASSPSVLYNTTRSEYLVAWAGNDTEPSNALGGAPGDRAIHLQRVAVDGSEVGDDLKISDAVGGELPAGSPALAYNPQADEYLAVWSGTTVGIVLGGDGAFEIFGQRLSGDATPIGADVILSDMGPVDDRDFDARSPDVAYNTVSSEYLVAWDGDDNSGDLVDNKFEVYVQRVTPDGAEIGTDTRISQSGADTFTQTQATTPTLAYNPLDNQYLLTWRGPDLEALNAAIAPEIYGQTLTATATKIGTPEQISTMGPFGDADYSAFAPAVVHSRVTNEYLVAWSGDDDTAPLVDNEFEVWARGFNGGGTAGEGLPGGMPVSPGAPAVPNCVEVTPAAGGGASGTLKLTPAQLKINQRIGQAAIRRATAIQRWLDAGIVNGDLCGGGLLPAQLHSGVAYTMGLLGPVPAQASPRTLSIPAATPKPGVTFELSAEQLQINQKVYSAAVRRANALKERIEGKLTGGDITDAQLTADRLRQDLTLGVLSPTPTPTPASTTDVPAPTPSTANFTPTIKQLRINQKIAQAAVKRTNELRATLASGLTGENFADGSVTAVDFAP